MNRPPLHRLVLSRRLLRLGYRVAAAAARAWWTVCGSRNHGAKCVLFNAGDVLLVRHTYGDRRAWDFPGGFVRRHEHPVVTARRELAEELGVDHVGLSDLGPLVVEIGRRRDTVHYFHAQLADRRLLPDDVELAEVGWFAPGALPRQLGEHVAQVLARLGGRPAGGTGPAHPTR